jgi:hypothetical protein
VKNFLLMLLFSFLLVPFLSAKRLPPKTVPPVETNGVRYSAEGDGRDQVVVATDVQSGKELWRAKVLHTKIKYGLEEDVQWVFLTHLKLADNTLLVRDEKSRCYSIDLESHRVKKAECGNSFVN